MKIGGETGVFAKSQQMQSFMQNGLQFNGDPTSDIIRAQILGLDSSEMSWAKKQKIDEAQQSGFLENPKYLGKMMEFVKSATAPEGSTLDAQAGFLSRINPELKGKGAKAVVTLNESGFFKRLESGGKNMAEELERLKKGGGAGSKEAADLLEQIKKNPANGRQAQDAQVEILKIQAGDKLNQMFLPMERSVLEMTKSLADGDWKKSFSTLMSSSDQMGTAGKLMLAAGTMQLGASAMSAMPGGAGKALAGRLILPALAALGTGGAAYLGTRELLDFFSDGKYSKGEVTPFKEEYSTQAGNGKAGLRLKTEQIARIRGVDPNIAKGLVHAESGWNPNAVSPAGARGLSQVMPFHFKAGEDPFNVDTNLNRGLSYYKEQLTKYKGDQQKALAAYNAGPGRVDSAVKKHGDDWLKHMPKETQAYVPRVLKLAETYRGFPSEEALERSPLKLKSLGGQAGVEKSMKQRTGKFTADKQQAPDGPRVDRGLEIMQEMTRTGNEPYNRAYLPDLTQPMYAQERRDGPKTQIKPDMEWLRKQGMPDGIPRGAGEADSIDRRLLAVLEKIEANTSHKPQHTSAKAPATR